MNAAAAKQTTRKQAAADACVTLIESLTMIDRNHRTRRAGPAKKGEDVADEPSMPDVKSTMIAEDAGADDEVKDDPKLMSAVKFALAGNGQSGNNLCSAFWEDVGYRKIAQFNTNDQDMYGTQVPKANCFIMGDVEGGAGKDPAVGRKVAEKHSEDIISTMRRAWAKKYDRVLLCNSVSGGTGAGGFHTMFEAATAVAEANQKRRDDGLPVVGAILTLPTTGESAHALRNALDTLKLALELVKSNKLSPLILIDNSRFQSVSALNFYKKVNLKIVRQLARFNHVAALRGGIDQFDKKDWDNVLASGILTFGLTVVDTGKDDPEASEEDRVKAARKRWANPDHISKCIRDKLSMDILLDGADLKTATHAGCIMVGKESVLEVMDQNCIEEAYKSINRQIHPDAVVHRGMFIDEGEPDLLVATVFGGLAAPLQYIADLEATMKKNEK